MATHALRSHGVEGEVEVYRAFVDRHIVEALRAHGWFSDDEHALVARCLHEEHIHRVIALVIVMDEHPPRAVAGMPAPVRDAIQAMRAVEALMDQLAVPRPDPETIRERVDEAKEVRDVVHV